MQRRSTFGTTLITPDGPGFLPQPLPGSWALSWERQDNGEGKQKSWKRTSFCVGVPSPALFSGCGLSEGVWRGSTLTFTSSLAAD